MQVLEGTALEISMSRRVARPRAPNTILIRGRDSSLPDLVCGACGAVLAIGIPAGRIGIAIACTLCDAVNEAARQ